MENILMLPDENEMSFFDCDLNREKCLKGKSSQGSAYIVVVNKGLHPTRFINFLLYKPKTLQSLDLFIHVIPFWFLK